jgi:hypothetical protein
MMIFVKETVSNQKMRMELYGGQTVKQIKEKAIEHFRVELIQVESFLVRAVLEFNGSDLQGMRVLLIE